MRWALIGGAAIVGFVVLAGLLSSRNQAADTTSIPRFPVSTQNPDQPPLSFAYFYYWYDLPSGPHSGALTDRPAEPNASYQDVGWFKKQLSDMSAAGIDVALAVYWGPFEPSSDIGLANMAEAAAELRAEGREPPKIAMFLDTGLIGRWPKGDRDLRKLENQQRFYDLVHTFHSILPRDDWAMIDGRPVVWMWASWFDISFDQSLFDYVSSRFASDFGADPYVVAEASWRFATDAGGGGADTTAPIDIDNFYVWGAALNGFQDTGAGVAQVGPGYDERELDGPGRSGRFTDRNGGRFYQRNLEAALASGERFIAIETWNEFHEASDIADSVEYGRQYIEITRRYMDQFKAKYAGETAAP